MRTVVILPTFAAWREEARALLRQGVSPDEVLWCDDAREAPLFAAEVSGSSTLPLTSAPKVSAAFLDLAQTVSAHTAPARWALLYRLLWRLTHGHEPHLLALATDAEVRQAQEWAKAVRRDIHKMHAFVRFRLVGHDEETGREQFVAWFEPEHGIVRLAAPFFEKRFAGIDWSILTPRECAHWDGAALHFTPGVARESAPDEDALEELWRTYYRSIFNPARLKVKAMQAEMPKRYWKNLPEAPLIQELITGSDERVRAMIRTEARPVKAAPENDYLKKLRLMREADRQ